MVRSFRYGGFHSTLLFAALTVALPTTASAQAVFSAGTAVVTDSGDSALVIVCALLALLVVPGIALAYAGQVRAANILSATLQPLLVALAASLAWVIAGYTLAFGQVTSGWIGSGNAWMLLHLGNVRNGTTVPESAFALFQIAIAVGGPALLTGAWAGRARLGWAFTFCSLWSLAVLAPAAHWLWCGGWLFTSVGTLDWAGGLTLRTSAGVSALVCAAMLGRGRDHAHPSAPSPYALLAPLGAMLASLGLLGISAGWALGANDDSSSAVIAAYAGVAAGTLAWLLIGCLRREPLTAQDLARAVIAASAALSAPAGYVSPGGAIAIGVIATVIARFADRALARSPIDDRLGVFAGNAVAGAAGALLLAPFLNSTLGGTGYRAGMSLVAQLAAQGIGILVITVWSLVMSVILAVMISVIFPMRVSEDAELQGLDPSLHTRR